MGLFLAIAGVIAAGIVIAYVAVLTVKWLISKVKTLLAKRNVKKVAAMDLERLIDECPNQTCLQDLLNEGVDEVIASVDDNGRIEDVECIKAGSIDESFTNKLGPEGMIVING